MRGRRPTPLTIPAADLPILQAVARSRRLCWFQVQHARIVLAVAGGERVHEVASRLECDRATVWRVCRRYERGGLTKLLLADGIVEAISPALVRRILREVDLQPHRTRYWRTTRLDGRFKERAEKVLWCYGNAERLARRGVWVVCADEVPNLQVLERTPIRRAIPGHVEQQEFEYTRHGTVNLLLFLVVHTGEMEVTALGANDAAHYIPALRDFRRRHRGLKGVFLIHDGGPSHIAQATSDYLEGCAGWWRP